MLLERAYTYVIYYDNTSITCIVGVYTNRTSNMRIIITVFFKYDTIRMIQDVCMDRSMNGMLTLAVTR